MSDDFKARLIQHAKLAKERAGRALSEAATQQYLIMPFIQLLGYDPLNPDEVIPEAHASFSDKFKNRVDYAICQDGDPVIAIECKKVGTLVDANRGELKGYFNAVSTVKLGILTDGLQYQLYSDTGRENMMDDEPFVEVDLQDVAEERITDNAFDALLKLRRGTFDPAYVGADARRRIYVAAYVDALDRTFSQPDESMVRALMDLAKVEGRRTSKLVEEHTPIVAEALEAFFDKKLLERVGFADRQNLVRMAAPAAAPAAAEAAEAAAAAPTPDTGIVTTETELAVFDYVCRRLPFLIQRDEKLYQALDHLFHRDFKTVFTVCYKQDRKGKLFNFQEGSDPKYRFEFPDSGAVIATNDLADIDRELHAAFVKKVQELG